MSKKNLFKMMFVALVSFAATAFVGCSDNEEDEIKAPQLVASPSELNLSETTSRGTVEIQANCEWRVNAPAWADVTPLSGRGNKTIEVSVDPEIVQEAKSGNITFTLIHDTYGEWGKAESKVKVVYTYNGTSVEPGETGELVYGNNFDKETATQTYGKEGKSWPYLDQFEGWKNQEGKGAGAVDYLFAGVSARANSTSNSNYSDYDGSGANNMFFGASSYLTITNISVETADLQLQFGAEKYTQNGDSTFNNNEMQVCLSEDGENWSAPINYSFPEDAKLSGRWNLATADFTLPEGTTTLYIRFTATVASVYRVDDVKLYESEGGQQITFDGQNTPSTPGETVEMTIAEVVEKCKAAGSNQVELNASSDVVVYGVVVPNKAGGNTVSKNLPIMAEGATEGGNGILLYGSGITDPTNDAYNFEAGDKVKVTLKAGLARVVTFNSVYEVTGSATDTWCEIEKVGTAEITPITITVDKMVDYQSMVVKIEGVTSPATSQTWTTEDAYKTHTFTVGSQNLTVYVQANATDFMGKAYGVSKTGTMTGYVTLYQGKPQIMPRYAADVADFTDENAEPLPDPEVKKGNFARVTTLTPGKQYILVGETGSVYAALNSATVATGSGSTPDAVVVNPVDGVIEMKLDAAVTIEETTGGYTLKGSKGYLTYPGDGTKIVSAETATVWTATAQNGVYTICDAKVTDRAILCRYDADYKRFGAYKTSNLGSSGYYGVVLYELDGTVSPENPEPEPEPEPEPDPEQPSGVATIAEILALGQNATIESASIEGVVISNMALNNLTSKKGLYVQDATGGLQFYMAANHEFAFGDKVKIDLSGAKIGAYNGAVQISGLALEKVEVLSSGNAVEAKTVTMADFLANKYEGQYVALEGVQVASADLTKTWVSGGAHTSINMEDANGNKFVVFSSKFATYGTETVAQGSGTLKGISSINNGTMQIIFAQTSDYAALTGERFGATEPEPEPDPEQPSGVATIAEILALGQNATIESASIEGVVISNMALNNLTSKKGLYVQDATGGLQFYMAANHEFAFGDKVKIDLSGAKIGAYNGAVQISGLALEKVEVLSSGNAVEAKTVTMADFLANKYEGQYVALEGVQVASADLTKTWVSGGAHTSINMEDANGNKFVVFSSKYATYGTETVAQGSGTLKGISSINNGALQILFAQTSDYVALTGERFGATEPEPEPDPEQPVGGSTATISFADSANRTVFNENQQVWEQNGITVTNNKAASTNPVADYANPARFYANSELIISATKPMVKIVINSAGGKNLTLNGGDGYTVEGSATSTTTITLNPAVTSFTIAKLSGQVRVNSIEVTFAE